MHYNQQHNTADRDKRLTANLPVGNPTEVKDLPHVDFRFWNMDEKYSFDLKKYSQNRKNCMDWTGYIPLVYSTLELLDWYSDML